MFYTLSVLRVLLFSFEYKFNDELCIYEIT